MAFDEFMEKYWPAGDLPPGWKSQKKSLSYDFNPSPLNPIHDLVKQAAYQQWKKDVEAKIYSSMGKIYSSMGLLSSNPDAKSDELIRLGDVTVQAQFEVDWHKLDYRMDFLAFKTSL